MKVDDRSLNRVALRGLFKEESMTTPSTRCRLVAYDGRCLDCGCYVEPTDKGCLNRICENYEQPEDVTRICRFVPMDMD